MLICKASSSLEVGEEGRAESVGGVMEWLVVGLDGSSRRVVSLTRWVGEPQREREWMTVERSVGVYTLRHSEGEDAEAGV